MSNTYTTGIGLAMPASGDRGWNSALNGNAATVDAIAPASNLNVITNEIPSATLNIKVGSGVYLNQSNVATNYAGTSIGVTANSTTYVYLTNAGSLTLASGFPTTSSYVPLASVISGVSAISTITDRRNCFNVVGTAYVPLAGGTYVDGAVFASGTTTGVTFAGSVTQKLGFFGHTPEVQPTMGSATANTVYSTNEAAMLQAAYNALRSLGLGS